MSKNLLNFVNNFSGVSSELIDELQDTLKSISIDDKRRVEITELMDTLRGNLDKVVQHGRRANSIVKNMLLHSREGSGDHRVVDINALVDEVSISPITGRAPKSRASTSHCSDRLIRRREKPIFSLRKSHGPCSTLFPTAFTPHRSVARKQMTDTNRYWLPPPGILETASK